MLLFVHAVITTDQQVTCQTHVVSHGGGKGVSDPGHLPLPGAHVRSRNIDTWPCRPTAQHSVSDTPHTAEVVTSGHVSGSCRHSPMKPFLASSMVNLLVIFSSSLS